MGLRYSSDVIINKFRKVHGDKYNYSLVVYRGCGQRIKIICPKHGIFEQIPTKHLQKQGCERCARELFHYNQDTTGTFINKAKQIHGSRYDYSLVDYKKSNIKVKIICSKHGIFEQIPNNHIMGMKCIKCANEENGKNKRLTKEKFIEKAVKVHGSKYDYSLVEYLNCGTKVKILCPVHGPFLQIPGAHLNRRGCPSCHESRGERKIIVFLESYGVKFTRQETFDRCRNVRRLHFDFFLPDHNTCIEYDGKQHFFPVDYFGGVPSFEQLKKIDSLKNGFCLENGIKIIRISYKQRYPELKNVLKNGLGLPDDPPRHVSFVPVKELNWDKVHDYLTVNGCITNSEVRNVTGIPKFYAAYNTLLRWVEQGRILKMESRSRKLTSYCLPSSVPAQGLTR